MNRILFALLAPFFLFATNVDMWQHSHEFVLKKDEFAKVVFKKHEEEKTYDKEGELFFRWTLYHNELLTLLVNYEGFPKQYILKKEYKRDALRVYLNDDYTKEFDRAYAVLRFREFENENATLQVQVHDVVNDMIEVDFIDPKKEKGENVK